MQTTIEQSGEVDIIGTGIEPGVYYLTLGFGRYLHLYSEMAWGMLEEAFKIGLSPEVPVIIQEDTADVADRLYGGYEEIATSGASIVIPSVLQQAIGDPDRLRITWIPAGGYWRLSPLASDDGM